MVINNRNIDFSQTQCRMARIGLRLGIRDLAEIAHVAPATLVKFEAGKNLHHRSIKAIYDALIDKGARFYVTENNEECVAIRKANA